MNLNQFPQYRKYTNERSYFKIVSANHCVEIQLIGKKYAVYELQAKQFPEKQFIAGLLTADSVMVNVISEEEYNELLLSCESFGEKI